VPLRIFALNISFVTPKSVKGSVDQSSNLRVHRMQLIVQSD